MDKHCLIILITNIPLLPPFRIGSLVSINLLSVRFFHILYVEHIVNGKALQRWIDTSTSIEEVKDTLFVII